MPDSRYFELNDDVGLAPPFLTGKDGKPVENPAAGSPEPVQNVSLVVGVPTQTPSGEIIDVATSVELKAIPGTRILKIDDVLVASAMGGHPHFHEVDAPSKQDLAGARSTTEDARAAGEEA